MSKVAVIVVDICQDCPFVKKELSNEFTCTKLKRPLIRRMPMLFPNRIEMPDDCPLPHYGPNFEDVCHE